MTRWSGVAAAYRESFATLCAGTVERLLADTAGNSHLDVGSGTGALAARAAALGRTVVAVDPDPDMVAMSAAVVPGRVLQASVPDLPFDDDTFDAVTANFVVNHVADPRAAMRDLARVARPGGRVAVTIWPARTSEWASVVSGAFEAAGVVAPPGQRLGPALDFERSVDGLSKLVEGAGLEAVAATELTWDWEIGVDALWTGLAGGVGTAGRTLLAQPSRVRAAAARTFREATAALASEGMLRLSSTAAYVTGRH